jgi:hypothetical protein
MLDVCSFEVPGRGLEPLRISPPDPKSGASANFATLAHSLVAPKTGVVLGFVLEPDPAAEQTPDLGLRNHRFQRVALHFKANAFYEWKTGISYKIVAVVNGE